LVSANQQSSDFRPVSRVANITADYKQLRFISSEKAREWIRATVDGKGMDESNSEWMRKQGNG